MPRRASGSRIACSAPGVFGMANRIDVLSRPVGPAGRRPMTRKRVAFARLSSIRARSTGTPYMRPARSEAMAATVASPAASSAAAAVDVVSSVATSGRCSASQRTALREPLRMREHALDLAELRRAREQVLRDVEKALAADHDVRVDEAIQRDVDRAFRAVFHGHHAVLRVAALDVVEDLDHRPRRPIDGGLAEALQGRLVRERRHRSQKGDRERRLERAARRQDLAPDRARHVARDGTGVGLDDLSQDLSLTLRHVGRNARQAFEVSDLESSLGALVEEVEDLVVEVIDPGTPVVQVHGSSC